MVERTKVHGLHGSARGHVFRKVRSEAQAGDDTLKVTLFVGRRGYTCGWYIGPLAADAGRMSLPYLPRSEETMASVALVRAIRIARETRGSVCLVDPR